MFVLLAIQNSWWYLSAHFLRNAMTKKELVLIAQKAQKKAYAPYSNFRVGSAVLTKSGKVFTGCNVENSSYSLTCCAERIALFNAVSAGELQFKEIAIVGDANDYTPPCGSCRQVILELAGPKCKVHMVHPNGKIKTVTISELVPYPFGFSHLSA